MTIHPFAETGGESDRDMMHEIRSKGHTNVMAELEIAPLGLDPQRARVVARGHLPMGVVPSSSLQ
jgi:hypothetical protein